MSSRTLRLTAAVSTRALAAERLAAAIACAAWPALRAAAP
jgi:hypothetical protein